MMHIACAADEAYLPHCAAMLVSLFAHNQAEKVTVHFLHGPNLRKDLLEALESMIRGFNAIPKFHEITTDLVEGLQSREGVEGVMWYRVLLPELLPELNKILYLDADLIVVDSLSEVWATDLGSTYAAAVGNVFEPRHVARPVQLGMRCSEDYFNSGLMLLNLKAMRAHKVSNSIFDVARKRKNELKWQDQDPFNIVFDGNWIHLHLRWNCQNSLYYFSYGKDQFGLAEVNDALENPAIIHFEGPNFHKPWHRLCKHPFQADYLQYRRQTPWPEVLLDGDTLRNRLLRLLPARLLVNMIELKVYVKGISRQFTGRNSFAANNQNVK